MGADQPHHLALHAAPGRQVPRRLAFNAQAAADALNYIWDKENNFRVRSSLGPEFEVKPVNEYTIDVVTESPDPLLPTRLFFAPIALAEGAQGEPG